MLRRSVLPLLAAAALAPAALAAPAPPRAPIAIVGADVLTLTSAGRLSDQTVLVDGERIAAVGPRASTAVPPGYRTIQAKGLTLMPGLVDMHVHLAPAPAAEGDAAQRALAVMLAHGVTTARTMAGSPLHPQVRSRIEAGEVAGPRLYAASPPLHEKNTADAEAARTAVRAAKAAGFDLIKSHHLDSVSTWTAVQEEAAAQGIPVAGHVNNAVGLDRALAAKQQVEHLDGTLRELIPAGSAARGIDFAQIPPPPVLDVVSEVQPAAVQALAAKVARSGGYQVPTLALFEKIVDVTTPTAKLAARPEVRFAPAAAVKAWTAQREQMLGSGFTADLGRQFVDTRRRIVRAYRDAGVPMMAGSDTAQSFHMWGPGLIEEVEAFKAAGLTNEEALRTATVVPRDYFRSLPNGGSALGWKAEFGTVEAGARADLILVKGDPSRDLAALRQLRTVIAGGRLYERAALDAMLAAAAAAAKAAG
jgi:imidazolonepropionase-like amidohydrolase